MMIAPDSITSSAAETGVPERNVLDVVLKLKYDKHGWPELAEKSLRNQSLSGAWVQRTLQRFMQVRYTVAAFTISRRNAKPYQCFLPDRQESI
jgi:hypothetical protein